jgi:hypothetical protein
MKREDIDKYILHTNGELKEMCKKNKIKYSGKNKLQLIKLLFDNNIFPEEERVDKVVKKIELPIDEKDPVKMVESEVEEIVEEDIIEEKVEEKVEEIEETEEEKIRREKREYMEEYERRIQEHMAKLEEKEIIRKRVELDKLPFDITKKYIFDEIKCVMDNLL